MSPHGIVCVSRFISKVMLLLQFLIELDTLDHSSKKPSDFLLSDFSISDFRSLKDLLINLAHIFAGKMNFAYII